MYILRYFIKLKADDGIFTIELGDISKTGKQDNEHIANRICDIENCPKRAIKSIKLVYKAWLSQNQKQKEVLKWII